MAESTATIKLRAVDTNVVSTINNISTASTNALLGATVLSGGFKVLEKASSTSAAQMAIGANNAQILSENFGKLATTSNKVTQALGKFSTVAFVGQQLAIAADGAGKAYEKFIRLPQAMQAMQASGVSTYPIQQFNNLAEAIKGSDVALDSLLVNSIAELGEFEKAAARAGTILKSSFRFDEAGNPLTANAEERLENALSVQKLVNEQLNNSVTSTQALLGQYEVLSSGFTSAQESQQVLEQGLKLITIGQAGGVAVNTTATLQLLTKTLNAYELQAEDAAKVAAKLNAVVENGLTTIPELSLGFGRMAAQASKANIALNDSAAAISVLTAQGTSTAEAMTGVARLSASIIDKTPEAEKELAKLQIRGEKIRFDKAEIQAKGFTQALIDLNDAAGGSSEILSKIFPEDVAFRTANALLTEQGRRLSSTRDTIAAADQTRLNEIFEVSQSGNTARFMRLANRFKESVIELGLSLAPTLEPGIKALETIANKFAGLPEPVREAIGKYLAFRIASKAATNAAGELLKTLAMLATNYLSVRLVSLALTGQLGKEAKAVKDLIVQKKGLAAATMQLFGVDQKWRLEQESATEVLAKQSKVAAAASKVKAGAAAKAKEAIAYGVAKTSGTTKEQATDAIKQRYQQALALGRQGVARAANYARELAEKYDLQIPQVGTPAAAPRPPIALLPPARESASDGRGTSGQYTPPPTVKQRVVSAREAARQRLQAFESEIEAIRDGSSGLDNLVERDRDVVKSRSANQLNAARYDKLIKEKELNQQKISQVQQRIDRETIKLREAQNQAVRVGNDLSATELQRTKALQTVEKQEQKLRQANLALSNAELNRQKINTAGLVSRNKLIRTTKELELARNVARTKYAPLAQALTQYEAANAAAVKANQAATVAKLRVEGLELTASKNSKVVLLAKRDAYLAEIAAKRASVLATKQKVSVEKLNTEILEQAQSAEKGLYQTRLFGRTWKLSEVGLMGKINKALTANIAMTNLATLSEKGYAKAKATTKAITDLRNIQISAETAKLAALNVKAAGGKLFGFLVGGAGKAADAIAGIASPLGALLPLFAAGTIGAIALREEFFGLSAEGRKLAKTYDEFIKEQEKLNSSIQRRVGLTRLSGLTEGVIDGSQLTLELIELKDVGAITADEFTRLSSAVNSLGDSSIDSEAKVKQLRNELRILKAEAPEVEKGVIQGIASGIKSIPAIAAAITDAAWNTTAAGVVSFGNREIVTPGEIAQEREAGRILESINILGNLGIQAQGRIGETSAAVRDYRENLALTSDVQQKVSQGFRLTTADFENEKQVFKERADRNRLLVEQIETKISEANNLLAKTKNQDNQNLILNQIQNLVSRKVALEQEGEALKKLQEQAKEYLENTLPAVKTALKESANPVLALTNAQEKFDQAFLVDGEGRTTKMLKPIETLRDEGAKLVAQIQENLSLGLLDEVGSGEAIAAEKIREIRDNQISFMENGELVTGYRYTIAQRRELTSAVIQLENADLKRTENKNKIEIDLAKSLQQARLETTAATNLKIAELQDRAIADRISQKEREIQELKDLGLRTINEEIQLEQLRSQQQGTGFGLDAARLQARLDRSRFDLQQEQVTSQRRLTSSRELVSYLERENTILQSNLDRYQKQLQLTQQVTDLGGKISQNEVYNAQVQQRLATAKIANLKKTLPIEKGQLLNQVAITEQQREQQLLNSEISAKKAELALNEANQQLNLARRNQASQEQLARLELELEQKKLSLSAATSEVQQAQFKLNTERELNQQRIAQFDITSRVKEAQSAIALSTAQRATKEAEITKELRDQGTAIQENKTQLTTESDAVKNENQDRVNQAELSKQLTDDEEKKLKRAQQIANLKITSLQAEIKAEARILAINQDQARLKLESERRRNEGQLGLNRAEALKAQAEVERLKATGASQPEIDAAQKFYDAQIAQRQYLLGEERRIEVDSRQLRRTQAVDRQEFVRRSRLRLDRERAAAIDTLPEEKQGRARKRLAGEMLEKSGLGETRPNLTSTIDAAGRFKIEVPDIKIQPIDLPSLDDIKADLRSLKEDVKSRSSSLNAAEGEGKKFVIQNLSFDGINININGAQDKQEIAEEVEGKLFVGLNDMVVNLENRLNQ